MTVTVRGTMRFPKDALPNTDALLNEHLWAVPKVNAMSAGRAACFPAYEEIGGDVLVPRYSEVVHDLIPLKPFAHEEPTGFGEGGFDWNPELPLREKQVPGADRAERVLERQRGCTIHGDTGSGKTVVGLNMIHRFQPLRVLVLVDQLDIADQWARRIRQFMPNARMEFLMPAGEERSIRNNVHRKVGDLTGKPSAGVITIGTAQSMHVSQVHTVSDPFVAEMLICDEVHVFGAPTFMGAVFKVNFGRSIGLTATPDRKDELQWIFFKCLGPTVVRFEGDVMTPIVRKIRAPNCGINSNDWRTSWCASKRGNTCLAMCRECAFFPQFPDECGGNLERTQTNKVKWKVLNRVGVVKAWTEDPEYVDWLMRIVIEPLYRKKRSIFCFGEFRGLLIELYQRSRRLFSGRNVGIFLGKGSPKPGEPDLSHQRDTALDKPLTFVTYGVARKALDVQEKDCAVFATPISDARQASGRVRRSQDGKRDPLIVVPVPRIQAFEDSWERIKSQFEEEGWSIRV